MSNQPLVSVSVLTFNQKNYIKQCLDSILAQKTNFKFEILIGEDESTDGTRELCVQYANKYPNKINLFLRSRDDVIYVNGNATGRFNFIENLKSAKGKYIALCEGDDYWTDPLKLQKQVDFLETNNDCNICFHRANILINNKAQLHEIPSHVDYENIRFIDLLKSFNFITTASVVFRKPNSVVLPTWFEKVPWGDLALYKIVGENSRMHCLSDVMSVYRIHKNGIYSQFNKFQQNLQALRFYKIVTPHLNKKEREICSKRRDEILNLVVRAKASKNSLKRIFFNFFYRLKY